LARYRRGRQTGFITDAFASDGFARAVLAALQTGTSIATDGETGTEHAELHFLPAPSLTQLQLPPPDAEIRRFSVEQSNSSLVIGDSIVLKLLRRLTPGVHPEVEMTRYLTEAGVAGIAPLLGHVERTVTAGAGGNPDDQVTATTLIVQAFVRNQGDAWGWTIDWLRRALSEAQTEHAELADPFAGYLGFAGAIGRRLAEVHAALSLRTDDPAFAPEPATSRDSAVWAEAAVADLNAVLDALAGRDTWDNAETQTLAQSLIEQRPQLLDAIRRLGSAGGAVLRTRVHGDFHLGQVLVTQGDAVIVDFEGEPARSLTARRAKTSPAKDVAGLLRSFDYAAAMLSDENPMVDTPLLERRRATLELWRQASSAAFLDAYRAVAEAQPSPWLRPSEEQDIIDIFLIEKVAYEIGYEIANRPAWLHVPLRGLERLARRLLA
jgi:maltose alpha-D-glucosyltransferase/alpha-amylase